MMFKKQIQVIQEALLRFPLPFAASLVAFSFAVAQTQNNLLFKAPLRETFIKGQVLAIIAFFLLYTWKLLTENLKLQTSKKWLGIGGIALFLAGFYFWLLNPVFKLEIGQYTFISRQVMLYIAVIIGVLWLPFFKNGDKNNALWRYVTNLKNDIAQGMAMAVILMLGIFAIFATIDALFAVRIDGDWYLRVFLLLSHVIAPFYVMAVTPKNSLENNQVIHFNQLAILISKYILIPLISVYAVIVYAYLLKTLVTLEWPKHGVAELISGFIIVGIMTYFLTYPERDKKNAIGIFHKYFFLAVLPMIIALWAGIGVRIAEYGVSINRYLIVVFGLYALSLVGHYTFSKKKNLQVIFINLLLFIFISGFVPFVNAFAVTRSSQVRQLEQFIADDNYYQAESALDSIIDVSSAKYLEKNYGIVIDTENTRYQAIGAYLKDKNLNESSSDTPNYNRGYKQNDYFDFQSYTDNGFISIDGYKSLLQFNIADFPAPSGEMFDSPFDDSEEFETSLDGDMVIVRLQDNILELEGYFEQDLSEIMEIAKEQSAKQNYEDANEPLILEGDDYLIVIKELSGETIGGESIITILNGYLLIK